MYNRVKKKVYDLLHPDVGNTRWDKVINAFLITVIILNVVAVILETVPSIRQPNQRFFDYFDGFSVGVFTVEYILRVWSSNCHERYRQSFGGRVKYVFSAGALIDLLAILPYYVNVFVGFDLRILRIFRLTRILRLFRLTSYTRSTQLIINVFRSTMNELVLSFILIIFLIVVCSCLVFFAEHPAQPNDFSSIPATMWWSVMTLTTVGYGDMVPHTELGKFLTVIISLAGIAFLAVPAGIITAGFLDETKKMKNPKHFCPHCGKPLDGEVEHGSH